MPLLDSRAADSVRNLRLNGAERAACALFVALTAVYVATFALECGAGPCPDDPTGYLLPTGR